MSYALGDVSILLGGQTYVVNAAGGLGTFTIKSGGPVNPSIAAELYGDYQGVGFLDNMLSGGQFVAQTSQNWDDLQTSIKTILFDQTLLKLDQDAPSLVIQWTNGDYVDLANTVVGDFAGEAPAAIEAFLTSLATKVAQSNLQFAQNNYALFISGHTTSTPIAASVIESTVSHLFAGLQLGNNAATAAENISGVNLGESLADSAVDFIVGLGQSIINAFLDLSKMNNIASKDLQSVAAAIKQLPDIDTINALSTANDLLSKAGDLSDATEFASVVSQLSNSASFPLLSNSGMLATAQALTGNPSVTPPAQPTDIRYSVSSNTDPVPENAGSLTFTITRSDASTSATVYVSTVQDLGSTNTNSRYYDGVVDQPIAFTAGQTTASYTIAINDASLTSGSETFHFIVEGAPNLLPSQALASTLFTIVNHDAPQSTFAITTSNPTVNESAGSIQFTITRSTSNLAETIYVSTVHDQGYQNPDPVSGNYYYDGILNRKITFGVGQTSASVTVAVNDLGLTNGNETFRLIAQQDPSDQLSQVLATTDFTIVNNDPAVVANATVNETVNTTFLLQSLVNLPAPPAGRTISLVNFINTHTGGGQLTSAGTPASGNVAVAYADIGQVGFATGPTHMPLPLAQVAAA